MKFVCSVCGYVYEGDTVPAECPVCHAGSDKFVAQSDERTWAAEHVVGVAKGVSEDILSDLRANMKRLHGKKQNMLLNSQNFSAKL